MRPFSDLGLRISDFKPRSHDGSIALTPDPAMDAAFSNPQSAIRNPQFIELHIDELVLHGFSPGDRHAIAESVERELGRLLARQGLSAPLAGDIDVEQLNGGSFWLPAGGKAATTGSQIANAVFGAAASVTAPAELPGAGPAPGGETRP